MQDAQIIRAIRRKYRILGVEMGQRGRRAGSGAEAARHLTPSITMNRYAKADKAAIAPFVELPADARKPAPNVRKREVL